jgi:glycosyltransferase involved in cell wall biosynthesis
MILDVLMPFHREDNLLIEAIDSLADSSFKPFRLILIDDREISQQILSFTIENKLRNLNYIYLKTEGKRGYGRALSIGTDAITAPNVCLFNSDDLVHPERFSRQLSALEGCDVVFSKIVKFGSRGEMPPLMLPLGNHYHPLFLLFGSYGADASWMMTTQWWRSNAFFDVEDALDWRIALTTFKTAKWKYLPEQLYFYREHDLQITKTKRTDRDLLPLYDLWINFGRDFEVSPLSKSNFISLAAPYVAYTDLNFKEFSELTNSVCFYLDKNNLIKEKIELKKIISRRSLLSGLKQYKHVNEAGKFFWFGRSGVPSLIADLSKIVSKRAFHR